MSAIDELGGITYMAQGLTYGGVKASGLRVADASLIPWTPVSALNAPSTLIGYRAAELIRGGSSCR